ncbi:glycosyltransferase [Oribacterium sp. HCP3S3_B9]|uniref:glycosyltransferase n=1 Tax=Oribacterium sp. HCP3S3_B9 TaxID=3438946 RepID=UPI003F89EE74
MISVLMSIYKKERAGYLKSALDSVYAQTLKVDEIVLVQDGEIPSALEEVISQYPDLRIVKLKQNVQLGRALEAGMKVCKHELVARMDTDDIMMPDRLEKQYQFMMEHQEIAACGGDIAEFTGEDMILREKHMPTSPQDLYRYGKKRNPLNHMTVMFRKSAIEAVGGYRHFPGLEDYDLWSRLLANDYQIANIPEVLVKARIGDRFASRRGGWAYFKRYLQLRKEQHQIGYLNTKEYIVACVLTFGMTVMPEKLREKAYAVLRK